MNINKYFLSLPREKQVKILDIANTSQVSANKQFNIYNALFPEHMDFIYTTKKYEDICYLILRYAERINYYKKHGKSFGQYLKKLNEKLGL